MAARTRNQEQPMKRANGRGGCAIPTSGTGCTRLPGFFPSAFFFPAPDRQLLRPARRRSLQHRHQGLRRPAVCRRAGSRSDLHPAPVPFDLRHSGSRPTGRPTWAATAMGATGCTSCSGSAAWSRSSTSATTFGTPACKSICCMWQHNPNPEQAIQLQRDGRTRWPTRGIFCAYSRRHHRDRVSLHQRPVELLHPLGHHHLGPLPAPEPVRLLDAFLRLRRHGPVEHQPPARRRSARREQHIAGRERRLDIKKRQERWRQSPATQSPKSSSSAADWPG